MLIDQFRWLACCLMLSAAGGAIAENYEVGQVWTYKTRPQEPDSTLMILRIDNTSKLGQVVFIGLKEVRILHPNGNTIRSLSPLPFTKDALDKSVTKLVDKTDKVLTSNFGYLKWKEVQLAGKTPPTYDRPVAEIVGRLENGYIGIPQK
jgi:hypothetical protein